MCITTTRHSSQGVLTLACLQDLSQARSRWGQDVADGFCDLGIRALMTFSPRVLRVPPGVTVRYVDVSIELQILTYHLEYGRGPLTGGFLHNLGVSPVRVGSAS